MSNFQISPDSTRVVFRATKDTAGVFELYSTPIASAGPVKISGLLVAGGDVSDFQLSPDSARVVFRADKDTDDVLELYRVQSGGIAFSMDLDLDDRVLPLSDLLMFTRYQLGLRGAALIANAVGANATISSATAIEDRVSAALAKPQ